MTKEKIIEVFSRKAKEIIIAEYKVDDRYIFTNQGKEAVAEELFALIEQEKKEEINKILQEPRETICIDISKPLYEECKVEIENAKKEVAGEILQNLKEYIAYETKPFIKWGSDNPQEEIPDACIDSDMLKNKIDEIAKEYGVEL